VDTADRMVAALLKVHEQIGDQDEDVERFAMQHLGMHAATVVGLIARLAKKDDELAAAMLFFMWGVQTAIDIKEAT
jgi:hypothetical protein